MTNPDWSSVFDALDDDLVQRALSTCGQRPAAAPSPDRKEFPMHSDSHRAPMRRVSRTVLIAAVIAAVLTVAALAVVLFRMQPHSVPGGEGISGTWNGQNITYENAQMFFSFDIEGECRQAEFRAEWLPSEPSFDGRDAEGWTGYLTDDGEADVLPYVINIYTGNVLRDVRCTLNGAPELVLQDEWNGFQRMEFRVDYSAEEFHVWDSANYLLLFQPEGNYLVYIAGTSELSVLEKIAENLECRTGEADTYVQDPAYATDICWFDLGRG